MTDKITVRLPPHLAKGFNRYVATRSNGRYTRQDLVRIILSEWLQTNGFLEPDTGSEKPSLSPSRDELGATAARPKG
jgi:Arc/MetJ-type ribon-helix-helix transcriptional regulator